MTTTPVGALTPEAAGGVFDILVRFLRTTLRAVAVLGIVVAIAAFLSGRSPQAVQARARAAAASPRRAGRRGERATGWSTGQVGVWLAAHLRAVRVAVVAAGAVALLLWTALSTAWVVLWTGSPSCSACSSSRWWRSLRVPRLPAPGPASPRDQPGRRAAP